MLKKYIVTACILIIGLSFSAVSVHAESPFQAYYGSLKSDEVNVRTGPGFRYPVEWVYKRAGLPVRVVDSFEHWRKFEDFEGGGGWVHKNLISGKRTALIMRRLVLTDEVSEEAVPLAYLESNVIVNVEKCVGDWCLVKTGDLEGWLEAAGLWGHQ